MLGRRHKFSPVNFLPSLSRSGQFFTVKIRSNQLSFSRFAVVISSRYDKRAVYRNQLRRFIFNFIQVNLDSLPSGYDYLIIPHPLKSLTSKKDKKNKDLVKNSLITDLQSLFSIK